MIKYAIYLRGEQVAAFNTPPEAYSAAVIAYQETQVFHEVRAVLLDESGAEAATFFEIHMDGGGAL